LAFHYENGGESAKAVKFYLHAGEYAQSTYADDRGRYHFNKALGLTTDPDTRARALGGLGRAYLGLDQPQTAIQLLSQALEASQESDPHHAQLLYWLAHVHFACYDPESAEPLVRSALAQAETNDDKETLCHALALLGQIHSHRGELAAEQAMIRRGLTLARQVGNRRREANTLADLGFLQAQCGDFDDAAASARQALDLVQASRDLAAQAFAWNILGRAEGGRGRYQAAFHAFEQSEILSTEINLHPILAQIPNMRGWLLHQLCNYERAHQENLKGLEIALQTKKDAPEISARLNLCLDALSLQRYQEAFSMLLEIETRLNRNDFGFHGWRWRLRLLHIKGLALLATDEPGAALAVAREGFDRAQAASAAKYIALNHELMGLAESALGQPDTAIAHLAEAVVVADRIHYQPLRWQARQHLARHFAQQGENATATLYSQQADQIVETICGELAEPEVRQTFLARAKDVTVPIST
jgi:tetratricopeptide (TPR) repeat protein